MKDSSGSVFAIKYHTQFSDAVKFNMADQLGGGCNWVQFLNLAASTSNSGRHIEIYLAGVWEPP